MLCKKESGSGEGSGESPESVWEAGWGRGRGWGENLRMTLGGTAAQFWRLRLEKDLIQSAFESQKEF